MSFTWIGQSEDGSFVTLKKFNENLFRFSNTEIKNENITKIEDVVRNGLAIDIETTGLDSLTESIIEIGLRSFQFNRLTGEILNVGKAYTSLQDPGQPLSNEITDLTGITTEMVKNQHIDWKIVQQMFESCHIVIAHNALFDRAFIEKVTEDNIASLSSSKIWGCSLNQVDWLSYGYRYQKLEVLSIYHGFYINSHRAMHDVNALIHLLSFKNQKSKTPYLLDIINNAKSKTYLIEAKFAAFEKKELLKGRGYKWNLKRSVWFISVFENAFEAELQWLTDKIYEGNNKAEYRPIHLKDTFKSMDR